MNARVSLDIRPAVAGDGDAIWEMIRPVFRAGDTYAVDPEISKEDALAYWLGRTAHVYIAEDDAPLGTFYIRENHPGGGSHVCNCGYITAPEAQGKGVARAMLAHSLEEAKRLGFAAMQFNFVLTSNTRAVALWERAGFATVGRQPKVFRLPDGSYTDALTMHRFL